jgi:hypothetical protein
MCVYGHPTHPIFQRYMHLSPRIDTSITQHIILKLKKYKMDSWSMRAEMDCWSMWTKIDWLLVYVSWNGLLVYVNWNGLLIYVH